MGRLNLSPEVRLGDLVAAFGVLAGGALAWTNISAEVAIIKNSQAAQVQTNKEIKEEFREIKGEQKEQGQAIRRVEDKLNRARL